MDNRAKAAVPAAAMLLFAMAPATAESAAEFYRGKTIQMVVSTGAGTVFDTYARLLGRYMIKHLPGPPSAVVPVNMPGAGGLKAINYLANAAPRDGSVISMTNQGLPLYQAVHLGDGLKADLRTLNWIGNLSASNQVLVTWHTSKTKTLKDAMVRETAVGLTGAGSITSQLPAMYNNMLGTKLKLVAGYINGTDINLGMERGELDGRGSNTWASYVALNPDWIKEHKINVLLQVGLKKEEMLPDVPLLLDLAKNEQERTAFGMMSRVSAISRPFATAPNVPADRVEALRRAFDMAARDPEFLAEARRQRLDVDAMNGEDLQGVIASIVDVPADVRATVHEAIQAQTVGKQSRE